MGQVERILPVSCAGEQFRRAEEAWFWTCGAMVARRDGCRRGDAAIKRNCDPDDILLCVERLLQTGLLAATHARVLGKWGQLGCRPSPYATETESALLWREAMNVLEAALVRKGILRNPSAKDYFP